MFCITSFITIFIIIIIITFASWLVVSCMTSCYVLKRRSSFSKPFHKLEEQSAFSGSTALASQRHSQNQNIHGLDHAYMSHWSSLRKRSEVRSNLPDYRISCLLKYHFQEFLVFFKNDEYFPSAYLCYQHRHRLKRKTRWFDQVPLL